MSSGSTNFKEYDPKKEHSNPDNPKDRGGSYDDGQDFDPTHGHANVNDEHATTELDEDED